MLKRSVKLFSLIWVLGLCLSNQMALAVEPTVTPDTPSDSVPTPAAPSSNSVPTPAEPSSDSVPTTTEPSLDSVTKPTRLEISLSRRRVTLYEGTMRIKSYRIAVGRPGWETPKGNFKVAEMLQKPTWMNPLTDKIIPGGHPENPLGSYWIGFWTNGRDWIGFHGTPNPESVGKAASHGCIRMYNKDIKELFGRVSLGTPVSVVP